MLSEPVHCLNFSNWLVSLPSLKLTFLHLKIGPHPNHPFREGNGGPACWSDQGDRRPPKPPVQHRQWHWSSNGQVSFNSLTDNIWWIFMASPWCSSSRAVAAEALSKHVHRSDYRETAKRRLERHLSQRRQATVEAKAWRRGGWWWWCGCCGLGDGFEEKKLGQNSKLTANCSKLCNIFFDFVYDLSTFLAHVYSVCNITNICSQKKICRMARMAQNIMSRWGFLRGSRLSTARAEVLTTKCRRKTRWVRRPSRAAVATGLRCQSGCRWRAHHNALLKPSISAREAYLKDEFDEGGPTGSETWNWKKGFFFWKDSHVLHLLHSLNFFRTFSCRCCGSTCQAPVKDGWRMPTDMWRGLRSFKLWRGECTSQVHSYFWIFPQIFPPQYASNIFYHKMGLYEIWDKFHHLQTAWK